MDAVIRRLVAIIAVIGTLYHLYLVIHPFTPLADLHVSLLDLTQVQRAAHVFLVAFLGYLLSFVRIKPRHKLGGIPLAIMTLLLMIELLRLDLPVSLKVFAVFIWICTMLPTLVPVLQKPSNMACALLSFLPFIYLIVTYDQLIYRSIMPEPWDMIMSYSEILLVLGVIFRLSGPIMPTIVMVFLLYNIYGNHIPGLFSNPGFDLDMWNRASDRTGSSDHAWNRGLRFYRDSLSVHHYGRHLFECGGSGLFYEESVCAGTVYYRHLRGAAVLSGYEN